MHKIGLLLVFTLLLVPLVTTAQLFGGIGVANPSSVTLEVSNVAPRPGEVVTLSLTSSQLANPSSLVWSVNGQVQNTWSGRSTVQLPVESLDRILVEVNHSGTLVARTIINPIHLDIIVEPQTYVPPTYRGRGLASAGSQVRLVAIVEERMRRNPDSYFYRWQVNGQVIGGGPQQGLSEIITSMPNGRLVDVRLEVSRPGIGVIGSETVQIPLVSPQVHFYPIHPLYGFQKRSLRGGYTFGINSDINILAVPYYLAITSVGRAEVDWSLAGQRLTEINETGSLSINLRRQTDVEQSFLQFRLTDRFNITQQARGELLITH